jgi:hypothetical protein
MEHHRRRVVPARARARGREQQQAFPVHARDFAARAELLDDLAVDLLDVHVRDSRPGHRQLRSDAGATVLDPAREPPAEVRRGHFQVIPTPIGVPIE